jgi:hypothetical protein
MQTNKISIAKSLKYAFSSLFIIKMLALKVVTVNGIVGLLMIFVSLLILLSIPFLLNMQFSVTDVASCFSAQHCPQRDYLLMNMLSQAFYAMVNFLDAFHERTSRHSVGVQIVLDNIQEKDEKPIKDSVWNNWIDSIMHALKEEAMLKSRELLP